MLNTSVELGGGLQMLYGTGIMEVFWLPSAFLYLSPHPSIGITAGEHIVFTCQALTGADGSSGVSNLPCNLLLCKSCFHRWWGPSSTVSRKISVEAKNPMGASQLIKPTTLIYPREQIHDRLMTAGHYHRSTV